MAVLLASILSLTTTAAPSPLEARQGAGPVVTFSGAGPNPPTYTLTPPFRGENITISKSSISIFSDLLPCCSCRLPGHILEPSRMSLCPRELIPRLTGPHPANPLSVSHISVDQTLGVCSFQGIDGGREFIVGAGSVDVGPPQTQVSLRCCAFSCIGFPQNCCA